MAWLNWLGMEEVGFGLSRKAWNGGSQFLPDWNSLEWMKLVLTWLEWLVDGYGSKSTNSDLAGFYFLEMAWNE
jgi:hypothetical protein